MTEQFSQVMMNNYGVPPIGIVSGVGCKVVDEHGKEYLDLLSGIAVNSLGYAHPAIVEAVTKQISLVGHTSNLFANRPSLQVATALKAKIGDDSARVIFGNSGAEANEAAFKLARLSGRRRILSAHHGFHGRTMGSLSMTGQPSKRDIFAPLPGGVEFYHYGDIDYLRKLVEINPQDTAAIILEPVQGESGVLPAPRGFLKQVRELCDAHDILMIVDEVQTGVGRTGDFFAFEYEEIVPDIVTMAKGLGGGLPIGACIAVGKAAKLFTPGSHGTTFGGNPVVCAAALAVLGTVDDQFLAAVRDKESFVKEELANTPGVQEVRGRGLLLGVVLEKDIAKEVNKEALAAGFIFNAPRDNVIRIAPPLIISKEELAQAVAALQGIIEKLNA
ncbi:MAG: acetylornithine transaminase [Corynebacterium sp.]|nr:acetylornithine transaminase [Corynebacterium sp.]